MVLGDQDPYLTPDRMKEFDQLTSKLDIKPDKVVFQGKHELNEGVLMRFATN
jgi:hypothetical protein